MGMGRFQMGKGKLQMGIGRFQIGLGRLQMGVGRFQFGIGMVTDNGWEISVWDRKVTDGDLEGDGCFRWSWGSQRLDGMQWFQMGVTDGKVEVRGLDGDIHWIGIG